MIEIAHPAIKLLLAHTMNKALCAFAIWTPDWKTFLFNRELYYTTNYLYRGTYGRTTPRAN